MSQKQKMLRKGMIVCVLFVSILIPVTIGAAGDKYQLNYTSVPTPAGYWIEEELPSGLIKIDALSIQQFFGDIDGMFYNYVTGIYNPKTDITNVKALATIDAVFTIGGVEYTGTIEMRQWAKWNSDFSYFHGGFVLQHGTGELENLHGHGSFIWTTDTPPVLVPVMIVHFAPS